jgi:hypothetical protein
LDVILTRISDRGSPCASSAVAEAFPSWPKQAPGVQNINPETKTDKMRFTRFILFNIINTISCCSAPGSESFGRFQPGLFRPWLQVSLVPTGTIFFHSRFLSEWESGPPEMKKFVRVQGRRKLSPQEYIDVFRGLEFEPDAEIGQIGHF